MQPQNQTELPANTLINNRYLIMRTIGRGGMGAVYETQDQRLGAKVALKQMTVSGGNVAAAFEREARILAGLRHPSLPKVSDFFSEGQTLFLVMEFIPGTDLGNLLTQRGRPFPVEDVLRWADQSLNVLEYLHVQSPPIIHRDIKPQNMKLTPAGEIVLLDFGLAKGYAASATTTGTGSIFAYTPNYAPLEQVQGAGTSPASDLYALAATLYHLLTGTAPPDVLQRLAATASSQADPLRPAHELNPLVPPAVGNWISHGLQLDQRARPASAAAMRAELQQIRQNTAPAVANIPTMLVPEAAQPATTVTEPVGPANNPTQRRRSPVAIFIAAALLVLLFIGGTLAFLFVNRGGLPIGPTEVVVVPTSSTPPESITPTIDERGPTVVAVEAGGSTNGSSSGGGVTSGASQGSGITSGSSQANELNFGPLQEQYPIDIFASETAEPGIDSQGNQISYDPWNVSDGWYDTAWRVPGDGIGHSIELDFVGPVRISEIQLIPGYAKIDPNDGTDRFFQNRRVKQVLFEFSDGSIVEASFTDTPELQVVPLSPPVISDYVLVVIMETTEPGSNDGRDFTPISEIVVIGEELL
jgi:serine/threonine protein kinase